MTMSDVALRISFPRFFATCENARWSLQDDIPWDEIVPGQATEAELDLIRQAAIVEAYSPTYAMDVLPLFRNEPQMAGFSSIQFYEEYKHSHALREYLRRSNIIVTDADVSGSEGEAPGYTDRLTCCLKFGVSEVFTAIFYEQLARKTKCHVLAQLCTYISKDEWRHLSWYISYIESILEESPDKAGTLQAALDGYQHQGLDALPTWLDFWNTVGREYTGVLPYLELNRIFGRIAGQRVSIRRIAELTMDTDARVFH